ncbi:glycosyltransferase family 2 protein [Levilactobacillus yonginensis]|uniref:glycosyltransferase family 2 protein n=1 Tax=Levilactobacillus yonginensis TaxID=1054041 RepID=UPI00345D2AE4
MRSPYFSIIIPVYNAAHFLERCLTSVLDQAFTDFEVLAVDDGSTDASLAVLQQLAVNASALQVFSQVNAGVSAARNAGLKVARGQYVLFLDPDDYLVTDALTILKNQLMSQPDIVCFNVLLASHGRTFIMPLNELFAHKQILPADRFLEAIFTRGGFQGYACNKAYRRAAIQGMQFDEHVAYLEDELFNVQLAQRVATILCLPEPLYVYRQHAESLVNSGFNPKKVTAIQAVDQMLTSVPPAFRTDLKIRRNRLLIELASAALRSHREFKQLRAAYYRLSPRCQHWVYGPANQIILRVANWHFAGAARLFRTKDILVKSRLFYWLRYRLARP